MNNETVAEKLSLESMLRGFAGLYNHRGSMIFSLYLDVNYITFGQLVWIRNNLPAWAKLLNENSGASVVSLTIDEKEKYERQLMAVISLKMSIEGDICDWEINDREVSKMFCGGIKKMLAMKIEKNFPPPFNFKNNITEERLFASDIDDAYLIYSSCHYRELTEEMIGKLFALETQAEISLLAENLGARLVRVKKKAERLRGLDYHHFVIWWREDAELNKRFHFALYLRQLLNERGIKCSVQRYEESPSHH